MELMVTLKHLTKEYSLGAATIYDLKKETRCWSFMVTVMTRTTENKEIISEVKPEELNCGLIKGSDNKNRKCKYVTGQFAGQATKLKHRSFPIICLSKFLPKQVKYTYLSILQKMEY